jgi:hypothetical protein
MTILSVVRDAATKLNQTQPSSVFSTTDTLAQQLVLCANETAEAVLNAHDWQKLTTLATLTGTGSSTAFDPPYDYDRMVKKTNLHSATWQQVGFRPARDLDNWLYMTDTGILGTPGEWIVLGGQFQVTPAMPVGETARFYYVSNLIVAPNSGPNKTTFTADSDTFRLPERLLRLGIVWRWRADRRMEYAEDLQNYEIALSEEIGKDRGSKILTVGRRRVPYDVSVAYPRALGS